MSICVALIRDYINISYYSKEKGNKIMYTNVRNNLNQTTTLRNQLPLNFIIGGLMKILFKLSIIYLFLKSPEFENIYHVIVIALVFYFVTKSSD
jgi:hypothetical protein